MAQETHERGERSWRRRRHSLGALGSLIIVSLSIQTDRSGRAATSATRRITQSNSRTKVSQSGSGGSKTQQTKSCTTISRTRTISISRKNLWKRSLITSGIKKLCQNHGKRKRQGSRSVETSASILSKSNCI